MRKRKKYRVKGFSYLGLVEILYQKTPSSNCLISIHVSRDAAPGMGWAIERADPLDVPLEVIAKYPGAWVCWVGPRYLIPENLKPLRNRVCRAICQTLIGGVL